MTDPGFDSRIRSTVVFPWTHIYSIGPFGQYVSFQSQQIRAVNTVSALVQYRIITKESRVAVVGGGLAGVTAIATLLQKQVKDLSLYERHANIMNVQEDSDHRTLHPNINFWPFKELSKTSCLPFLNWYINDAKSVVGMIRDEWDKKYKDSINYNGGGFNTEVKSVHPTNKDDYSKIKVNSIKRHNGATSEQEREYDLVLLASGFGLEARSSRSVVKASYWKNEKLENIVASHSHEEYLVAGTGDGGLIDAIRLLFNADSLGADPAVFTASQIQKNRSIVEEIIRIETSAKEIYSENDVSFDHERISKELNTRYTVIAENLDKLDLCSALATHRRKRSGKELSIKMFGTISAPFAINSAPIHKVLVAYALHKRWMSYSQNKVVKFGRKNYIVDYKCPNEGREKQKKFVRLVKPIDKNKSYLINRIGAIAPMKSILKNYNETALQQKQTLLCNHDFDALELSEYFDEINEIDIDTVRFDRLVSLIEGYLEDVYGYQGEIAKVEENGRLKIIVPDDVFDKFVCSYSGMPSHDSEIFGLPIGKRKAPLEL